MTKELDQLLENGRLFDAQTFCRANRLPLPREKVVICAQVLLDRGCLAEAYAAYAAVGEPVPADRLQSVGDAFLGRNMLTHAMLAYDLAGIQIPSSKLEDAGDLFTSVGNWRAARKMYLAAGAIDKIVTLAARLVVQNHTSEARLMIADAISQGHSARRFSSILAIREG